MGVLIKPRSNQTLSCYTRSEPHITDTQEVERLSRLISPSNLVTEFESRASGPVKAKPKQPQKAEAGKGKGAAKQGKLTLDQLPGLQDMFLARAINHLIMGELHELDPMIGDEGCQIRTPFILDMYRLVQEKMPANAVELVRDYRARTDGEQSRALERLRGIEEDRRGQDTAEYQSNVTAFVTPNPLEVSAEATAGKYNPMFQGLTLEIERHYPGSVSYLRHACSEASIYWEDVLDPFGISMLTDRHPDISEYHPCEKEDGTIRIV